MRGDLLEEPVDAIFNAANGHLAHGGGVAGIIARAAGPELERESAQIVRSRGPLPTGTAVVTTAGRLPFKGVIHVIGPRMGEGGEEEKLIRTLTSGFACAEHAGWRSVSFPAVSAGIFAVPLKVCAGAYRRAVWDWLEAVPARAPALIRLCLRDAPVIAAVLAEMPISR
ncbi:MAG: macro domain-containing protein [Betaproteobacteria bacterium]|nr:macro domain-containing protein [Betaproteobacteria bacterium]